MSLITYSRDRWSDLRDEVAQVLRSEGVEAVTSSRWRDAVLSTSVRDWPRAVAVFEVLGAHLAAAPRLDAATFSLAILDEAAGAHVVDELRSRIIDGSECVVVAATDCAGKFTRRTEVDVEPSSGGDVVLRGHFVYVADAMAATSFIVAANEPNSDSPSLFLVERAAVTVEPLSHADATRNAGSVTLDGVHVRAERRLSLADSGAALRRGLIERRLAAAAALTGITACALDRATEYAKVRQQFGRPIGAFQVLQHRLVDVLVSLDKSIALVERAALALADGDADSAAYVNMALSTAADSAIRAGAEDIQIHGGKGFLWENSPHLEFRQALALAVEFGSPAQVRGDVASYLMDQGGELSRVALDLGESAASLRAELKDWLEKNPPERYDPNTYTSLTEADRTDIATRWQRKLASAGWLRVGWPTEYGGRGADAAQSIAVAEEMRQWNIPPNVNETGLTVAAPALLHWGSDEQKNRFLPAIHNADEIWTQGYSEPDAGSDLASLRTTAVIDGDDYIVNGVKVWASYAAWSQMGIFLVRTDLDAPKHAGLTCLAIDMSTPGVVVEPLLQINGDQEFARVILKDVRVPVANRIGGEGQGWSVGLTSLTYERAGRSDHYRLDQMLRLLKDAVGDGKSMSATEYASFRDRFVTLTADLQALRQGEVRLLLAQLAGRDLGEESSIGKLQASTLGQAIAELAVVALGPLSLLTSGPHALESGHWTFLVLTSRYYSLASGSSEVQRGILAERILGLPRGDRR